MKWRQPGELPTEGIPLYNFCQWWGIRKSVKSVLMFKNIFFHKYLCISHVTVPFLPSLFYTRNHIHFSRNRFLWLNKKPLTAFFSFMLCSCDKHSYGKINTSHLWANVQLTEKRSGYTWSDTFLKVIDLWSAFMDVIASIPNEDWTLVLLFFLPICILWS